MPERKISAMYAPAMSARVRMPYGYELSPKIRTPIKGSPCPRRKIVRMTGSPRRRSTYTRAGIRRIARFDMLARATRIPTMVPRIIAPMARISVFGRPMRIRSGRIAVI